MANLKQRCPNCNALAFKATKSMATELGNHELENARISYWKCAECGCYAQLLAPQSKLVLIKKGQVTKELAQRVLSFLGLESMLPEILRNSEQLFRGFPGISETPNLRVRA